MKSDYKVYGVLLVIIGFAVALIWYFQVSSEGNNASPKTSQSSHAQSGGKPEITLQDLKNLSYNLADYHLPTVYLHDGVYHCPETNPVKIGFCDIKMETDKVAFGKLHEDGSEDAVVPLDVFVGGNTVFSELAVVNDNHGIIKNIACKRLVFSKLIDLGKWGRVTLPWSPVIKSVSIQDGVVQVDMLTYGPNDAHCCPQLRQVVGYVLDGDRLVENTAANSRPRSLSASELPYSQPLASNQPPSITYTPLMFHGYPCTKDCSGHEAGYEWAEEHDITDPDDPFTCGGDSESFIEGCQAWVEENDSDSSDDSSGGDN